EYNVWSFYLILSQFIVFAELLLTSLKSLDLSDCWSVSWWLFRTSMFQQNILDELSSSLFDEVQVYKKKMLDHFGELEKVSTYWDSLLCDGECSYFVSAAFLEAGIAEYKYGLVDASRLHLDSAQEACGLHLSLTGILGFRTIHQVDAKSQMVLVAKTNKSGSDEGQATEPTVAQNDNAVLKNARSSVPVESDEFCDILRMPRLVHDGSNSDSENTTGPSANISLSAIQQAAVLAQCLHVRSLCDILRIRWESIRSRTKQRALLMMENLVEDVGKEFPVAAQRIKMVFGVHMPTLPALRKEYGELLISCGIVGEALDIFKDLELWDNLIYCYRLLGKVADAVSLINARLSVTPNDPRLWCSLGDVTNNDDHYKKALEVSNNKSARAMDKDLDKAVDAFSRAVQIDPENGEAWNNIACLRNSWEIWENYSKVALDTGKTLEALKTVLNLSSNKRFNVDILDKVMTMLEEQPPHFVDTHEASDDANKDRRQSNQLLDIIGDILQQIVRSGGSNADVWGLYARWHKTKGNLMACSEALLKQVRSLQVNILFSC
ncbi:Tetratricopeptide repeat protein 27-like protein, partial [Dichanthelium oligosanthes]